ncbi:MAG: rRNA pseudouridine synthase [Spirochaetia bacterium]|nr:rRNA pseudouridine synthase [Spirochaetia bacterium]
MGQIKEHVRLDRLLANSGYGSRSDVKALILDGLVTVNGVPAARVDVHVHLSKDKIEVDGQPLKVAIHAYYMMNKPAGYVCSSKGGANPTVFDLLDVEDRGRRLGGELGIVGRLDLDTEGLLIFTTDGDLNHRLTSPKYHVPKTYFVQLENPVSEAEQKQYAEAVAAGVEIPPEDHEPGALCRGGKLDWKSDDTCQLTIYEGLYHEVKRIFTALGNRVAYLKRININNLALDPSLEPGEYRELSEQELSALTLTNAIL